MTQYMLNGDVVVGPDGEFPVDPADARYVAYRLALDPDYDPVAALTAHLVVSLQAQMDAKARALGYDDIKTAITYRGDPNSKFAAEAEGFFIWRSAVWTQAYALLAQVQQGLAQFPTVEEAIEMMPVLQIDVPG